MHFQFSFKPKMRAIFLITMTYVFFIARWLNLILIFYSLAENVFPIPYLITFYKPGGDNKVGVFLGFLCYEGFKNKNKVFQEDKF